MSSPVVDRIAEVLRDHQPWSMWDVRDSFWCQGCQRSYPDDAFTAHVAGQIAAAIEPDVDVAAEAIFKVLAPAQLHGDWSEQPERSTDLYRRIARAALSAAGWIVEEDR